MNIRDILAQTVENTNDEDLRTVYQVWTVLDRQAIAMVRSNLSYKAMDAVEAVDAGNVDEARMILTRSMSELWPVCSDAEPFCPLCASVQSAMFVDGVAIEVEEVRCHLLLLKDGSMTVSSTCMKMIHEYWAANECPEDGFTSIYEGPGWLAFVETV